MGHVTITTPLLGVIFFSLLGKPADQVICFTLCNFFFFNSNKYISASTGPIFTIFYHMKGSVWIFLIWTSFSNSSRDVAMATDFVQNLRNDLYLTRWHFETDSIIAILIQKYSMAIFSLYILYKFDQDWSSNSGEIANCCMIWQSSFICHLAFQNGLKITILISAG